MSFDRPITALAYDRISNVLAVASSYGDGVTYITSYRQNTGYISTADISGVVYGTVNSMSFNAWHTLFIGGKFNAVNGIPCNNCARFGGYFGGSGTSKWDSLGGGLDNEVTKVVCDNFGMVHFIGTFGNNSGYTSGYKTWRGNNWYLPTTPTSWGSTIYDISSSFLNATALIVTNAGIHQNSHNRLAIETFTYVGRPIAAAGTEEYTAVAHDLRDNVYVAAGNTIYFKSVVNNISSPNGWIATGSVGSGQTIKRIIIDTNNRVYVLTTDSNKNYLVDINGNPIGSSLNDVVAAGCSNNDGGVFIGGKFTNFCKYITKAGVLGDFIMSEGITEWLPQIDLVPISMNSSTNQGYLAYKATTDELFINSRNTPLKKLVRDANGNWTTQAYGSLTQNMSNSQFPICSGVDGNIYAINPYLTRNNSEILYNVAINNRNGIVAYGDYIYTTSPNEHVIYAFNTKTSIETVLAGARGESGYVDGTGSAARFSWPTDIVLSSNGILLVTDSGNNCVRMITQTGVVTTAAGNARGLKDGTGPGAWFYDPTQMCKDNGEIYINDSENSSIRITDSWVTQPEGWLSINTFARLSFDWNFVVDGWGNFYSAKADYKIYHTERIFGSILNFQTMPATDITTTSATLNGIINPNGLNFLVDFEWGLTEALGNNSAVLVGPYTTLVNVTKTLFNLSPNTSYYYRINASSTIYGSFDSNILTFRTGETVTFDPNGGSFGEQGWTQKTVIFGTPYGTVPETTQFGKISRTGYDFKGWWTSTDGQTAIEITAASIVGISGNHTLWAKWSPKNVTITFDDGTNNLGYKIGTSNPTTKTVTYGQPYGALATFVPTWQDITFNNQWLYGATAINENTIVTALVNHVLTPSVTGTHFPILLKYQDGTTPDMQGYPNNINGFYWDSSKSGYFSNYYASLPTPTRTGYVFGGWYLGANGSGEQITHNTYLTAFRNVADPDTHQVTAYASWNAANYTVTFNYQYGLNSAGTTANTYQTVTFGTQYGTLPTATKANYIFGGWYTGTNGTGTKIESTTIYDVASNRTLNAKWTSANFTVTFDPMSGSVSPTTKAVVYNTAIGTLPTPTRANYIFKNWYTKQYSNGKLYVSTTSVTETSSFTLYADWISSSVTLNFDANGGTVSPSSQVVEYNKAYGSLPVPYRQGYSFNGWYTLSSGGTLVSATTIVPTLSEHTIYAQWTLRTFNITFNFDDGNTQLIVYQRTVLQQYGTLPTATRTGYTQNGWWTSPKGDGTEILSTDMVALDNDITVYADWTGDAITVTFDGQGVEFEPNTIDATVGELYGTLYTPTRPGYTLVGWYTEADGAGTQITSQSTVGIPESHTLYAYWTGNNYTITFDAAGGAVSPSTKTVTYNEMFGDFPIPTKTHSLFTGWYYFDGTNEVLVKPSDTMLLMDNFTLTAHWEWMVSFDKMIVTKEGEIIGTALLEDGTYIVRMAGFTPMKTSTNPPFRKMGGRISGTVTIIAQDSDGEIVIGTSLGGFKFANGAWTAWGPTGGTILAITQDAKGRTVVGGTFNDKILRFNGTSWIPIARRASGYGSLPMMVAYDIDWLGAFVPAENVLDTIPSSDYIVLIREISIMPCNTDTVINVFEASKTTTFTAFRFDAVTNTYVQYSGSFKLLDADGNFVKNIINGMSIAAGQWMISGNFNTTGKYRIREGWGTTTEGVDYVETVFNVDCTYTTTTLTTQTVTTLTDTTNTTTSTTTTPPPPPPPPPPACQPYGGNAYGNDVTSVVPLAVCYNGTEYTVSSIGYFSIVNGAFYYEYTYTATGGEQLFFSEHIGVDYAPAWYVLANGVPSVMLGPNDVQCYDCQCNFSNLPSTLQYDIVVYSCTTGLPISISGGASYLYEVSSPEPYKYYRDFQWVDGTYYQIEIKAMTQSQTYKVEVYTINVC